MGSVYWAKKKINQQVSANIANTVGEGQLSANVSITKTRNKGLGYDSVPYWVQIWICKFSQKILCAPSIMALYTEESIHSWLKVVVLFLFFFGGWGGFKSSDTYFSNCLMFLISSLPCVSILLTDPNHSTYLNAQIWLTEEHHMIYYTWNHSVSVLDCYCCKGCLTKATHYCSFLLTRGDREAKFWYLSWELVSEKICTVVNDPIWIVPWITHLI